MKEKLNVKGVVIQSLLLLLWVGLMYYLLLPALNIHSAGLWLFVFFIVLLPAAILALLYRLIFSGNAEKFGKVFPAVSAVAGILLVIFFIILLAGSKMFHAKSYAGILKTETYDFTKDLDPATAVSSIALMDTDSAILLGNREIGSLSEVVSQYNVSEDYTQIDLGGAPLKVSALGYAGFFKYMGNKENGVPGYVQVDPVGQHAEYVPLEKSMNYVPSAYFSKDLKRKLRSLYPDKIFGNIHFEINEEGAPFYVATVYQYTIGLFGGETVEGAIVLDPVDGTSTYYPAGEIPNWTDVVYDGELLVAQYNWYGTLSNGFWNSFIGKKGCKKCTETISKDGDEEDDENYQPDFGYVAKDGDIWIYTGITSVNDDASNIGFLMVNERTGESHYYEVAGADENSAMAAAEGEVQEKGYQASFPSLINVDQQPTYVMVLKDDSGIVKLYAMVNVESYNIVTTSASLDDCFASYRKKIGTGNGESDSTSDQDKEETKEEATESYDEADVVQKEFTVAKIDYIDVDGNTYVYLTGEDGNVYKQRFADNEQLIFVTNKQTLKVDCVETAEKINLITKIY